MRTNSIDTCTRGKHRRSKTNHSKPKSKASHDDNEDVNYNLMSPVEKSRSLATSPVTPVEHVADIRNPNLRAVKSVEDLSENGDKGESVDKVDDKNEALFHCEKADQATAKDNIVQVTGTLNLGNPVERG